MELYNQAFRIFIRHRMTSKRLGCTLILLIAIIIAFSYLCVIENTLVLPLVLNQNGEALQHPLDAWAQFVEAMDGETSAVQSLISQGQNPDDCHTRQYFFWAPLNWGIGSDIHTIGLALGYAMQYKRTLVYDPKSTWVYTSPDVCGNTTTPDCFFQPLSRCQWLADAQESPSFPKFDMDSKEWESAQFVHLDVNVIYPQKDFIPSVREDWANRTVSWWRSQTTRYILRPLPSVLAWTRTHFVENLQRHPASKNWSPGTHPPPDSAMCIHVRHGDKMAEMRLHPMEDYLVAASDAVLHMGAPRDLFLMTDDGELIDNIEAGHYNNWNFTLYYTRYERQKGAMSPMDTAALLGRGYFARLALADLILAAHPVCAAFVLTTGSNWSRLVNEIRKTDGRRHAAPCIDLESGEWRRL